MNFFSNFLVAFCYHRNFGRFGSSSLAGGESDSSTQEGIRKPAAPDRWHSRSAWKHGTGLFAKPARMNSAMCGWRSLIMRRESTQLDQWAATPTRTALARPRPPAESARTCGRLGELTASRGSGANMTKHCHRGGQRTPASGMVALISTRVGSCGSTHHEEEVRRLWVIYPRDLLEKGLLFSGFALQKVSDESKLPDGNSQNLQPLLVNWKQKVTSPHHSVKFYSSRNPGQNSNPCWFQSTSIPHLRLPVMQLDVRVGKGALHRQPHARPQFVPVAHCVNIGMVRKDVLVVPQPPLYNEEPCCSNANSMGKRVSPRSPPSPPPTNVGSLRNISQR